MAPAEGARGLVPIAPVPHTEEGVLVMEGHGVRVVGPLFLAAFYLYVWAKARQGITSNPVRITAVRRRAMVTSPSDHGSVSRATPLRLALHNASSLRW
jgi:hypothetical protein